MSLAIVQDVPTYDRLMWPCLKALKAIGGSASNDELLNEVIRQEGIPDAIASIPHPDQRQTRLGSNLAWAKTYLKKAGALENSARGIWALTAKGEQMSEREIAAIMPPQRWRAGLPLTADPRAAVPQDEATPGDAAVCGDSEYQAATPESWRDQLLSALRGIKPDAFERLSQRLLRESGFTKVQVTGKSGDGGIDGIGVLRVNLLSFHVLFQCKRYTGSVGAPEIRNFRGAMVGRSDKGLFITTGTFTAEARREATRDGAPAIELIDGDTLCNLMHDLKLGLKVEMVPQITVDTAWLTSL